MNYKGKIKTSREKYLTKDEYTAFLKATKTNDNWYMLFYIMGNLGLRVGEVVRLRAEHIDKANLAMRVPTLKQGCSFKKGQGQGTIKRGEVPKTLIEIPMSEKMIGLILEYMGKYKRRTWLFPSDRDTLHVSESRVRRAFKHYAHKIKLNPIYSPHSLRHYRGTAAYKKLKDIRAVQGLLRHRNIGFTAMYAHLDLDTKREFTQALEDVE